MTLKVGDKVIVFEKFPGTVTKNTVKNTGNNWLATEWVHVSWKANGTDYVANVPVEDVKLRGVAS